MVHCISVCIFILGKQEPDNGSLTLNLFTDKPAIYIGAENYPKIMQDGGDGDENPGYIFNLHDNATAGFKYFDFKDTKKIRKSCA